MHDDRDEFLAEVGVRNTQAGDFDDGRMRGERRFDVRAGDVLATTDDDVLAAPSMKR